MKPITSNKTIKKAPAKPVSENEEIKNSFNKLWKSEEVQSMRANKQKVFNVYLAGVRKGKSFKK